MRTVVIDGVEYEAVEGPRPSRVGKQDELVVYYRPIPTKQKTIVQVAAEATLIDEEDYRKESPIEADIYDAIEQRLQALEKKLEDK